MALLVDTCVLVAAFHPGSPEALKSLPHRLRQLPRLVAIL